RLGVAGAVLEEPEELRGRIDHEEIAAVAERGLISAEAPVEGGEIGVAVEGLGVDGRRGGIPRPLDALGIPVGFGEDDLALALGIGPDLLGFGGTRGAALVGYPLALG